MLVNNARSVSEALAWGLHAIRVHGKPQPSRVGDVLTMPQPVMTVYQNPMNRVLLSPQRDANPFFHVMEALWMLAGRNDLPWLVRFNKRFETYSDDGGATQPGAYGYRWRNHFGHDQLQDAILELKRNPKSRRVVIAMWDGGARETWSGNGDQGPFHQPGDFFAAVGGSVDVPCNTHIYFDTTDDRLNMTVCCRSNDIIWGAYGANAVHFSFLLEYISAMTGIPMGVYRQFSNNYHLYTNVVAREELMPLSRDVIYHDPYLSEPTHGSILQAPKVPFPRQISLVEDPESFEGDLETFMNSGFDDTLYTNRFFPEVAVPMYDAYINGFKNKNYDYALDQLRFVRADDWRTAAEQWITRRKVRAEVNAAPFVDVIQDRPDHEDNAFGLERKSADV